MLGAEKHMPPAPCGGIPLDLRRLEIKKIQEFSLTEHRGRKAGQPSTMQHATGKGILYTWV